MASVTTPLQLTATSALLQNTGLKPLPAALTAALASFNATTVMANFFAAVSFYKSRSFFTETTLDALLSIGSGVCPALGNSIPTSPLGTYTNLINEYLTINTIYDGSTIDPSGFSMLIEQTGTSYLGDGDAGRFTQGFMAVQNYISLTNDYINSAKQANEYLGPTFTNMSNLTTGDITAVNTDLQNFGVDLQNQGILWDPRNLDLYGTPAGLLQQLSRAAKVQGQAIPGVQEILLAAGLTPAQIKDLVNNNQFSLTNPNGLTQNEFDTAQKLAYNGIAAIDGDLLTQVLDILDVTTPNVTNMAQLLDPVVMYPRSFNTMQTPTPDGPVNIFGSNGAVNSSIAPVVDSYLPNATGCDELGKIIPPSSAVANKAIEVSLKQITNIPNVPNLPTLAEVVLGNDTTSPWDPTQSYLTNNIVVDPDTLGTTTTPPEYYLAIDDVPGSDETGTVINLNNTSYWSPISLGGLSNMDDLSLISAQTTPVDSSVTDYFDNSVATGSGPDGTVTSYDVLGLAIDSSNFAAQLNTATTAINALQAAGSLNTLNTAYTSILLAANDAAVLTQITNANNAISALSASPYVTTLNTAWVYMANIMNQEKTYQIQAGIDYFNLLAGEKVSIYGFTANLPAYGKDTASQQACQFLESVADTTTRGGQAIIGAMREGRNVERMNAGGVLTYNQIPSGPLVDPIPVILPVNT